MSQTSTLPPALAPPLVEEPLPALTFRQCSAKEIWPIRFETLILGTKRHSPEFPGDLSPTTVHFGAFPSIGGAVACVTFLESAWQGEPAWQLRGMGVRRSCRGQGIGRKLLLSCLLHLRARDERRLVWCNAREVAVAFYQANGFQIEGPEFSMPNIGPHFRMWRRL